MALEHLRGLGPIRQIKALQYSDCRIILIGCMAQQKKIDIDIPFTKDILNKVQKDIFLKNNLDEGYIRPIVYLGAESLGIRAFDLSVNVAVAAWEWPSYMDPEAKENGISIIKSSHEQYSNPLHSGIKLLVLISIPLWHFMKQLKKAQMKLCLWTKMDISLRVVEKISLWLRIIRFLHQQLITV